jgi:hypothetical protein
MCQWTFRSSLEVQPRSAEDKDFLRMTSEAFHAAAGPRDVWLRGIGFLAVHCEIKELMSADPLHAMLCANSPEVSRRGVLGHLRFS